MSCLKIYVRKQQYVHAGSLARILVLAEVNRCKAEGFNHGYIWSANATVLATHSLSKASKASADFFYKPGLPIILCTGFSESVNEETAKAAGIAEYVAKPVTPKDLAILVRKLVDI